MNEHVQVPDVEGVDLGFTPRSYFTERDLGLAIPSDIMGQARRTLARRLAADLDDVPPELVESALSELERSALSAIHPSLMGGEYLPRLRKGEVEIARISLESVTADQISVRARRTKRGIAYAIVDEYDGGGAYELHPRVSAAPLSMRELVAMLDGAHEGGGAVLCHLELNADTKEDAKRLLGFVSVESDFYPELGRYYAGRIGQWYAAMPEPEEDAK